jgi:two-component system CheB/CheR fusion protein
MQDSRNAQNTIFTLLSTMSHDLRTPLTAMLNMINVIRDDPGRHCTDQNLQLIQEAGQELKSLLEDTFSLAKIESGRFVLKESPVALRDLLGQVVKAYAAEAQSKNIKLRLDVDSALPDMIGTDKERLRQVVTNLVSNALKYTYEGAVTLRALSQDAPDAADGQRLIVAVEDSGIGIPQDLQTRIFDSFFQSAGSGLAKEISGTGLGLAISKRIVEKMGGRLVVRSDSGKGSTFSFDVPCRAVAQAQPAPVRQPDARADLAGLGPLRVLIVEDNYINSLSFSQILEQQGFHVHSAANGKQALDLIREKHFDVVLMDVKMPVMDGLEATRRIRSSPDGRVSATKVVALTAYAMPEDRERVFEAGVDDLISKPIEIDELTIVLSRVLKK